jgi:hypothetical protein
MTSDFRADDADDGASVFHPHTSPEHRSNLARLRAGEEAPSVAPIAVAGTISSAKAAPVGPG